MTGMPLAEAARELDVAPVTLKRWLRKGAPCQPGRRGRGHATLIDPDAVRAWQRANVREAVVLEIAAFAPGVMADAVHEAWCNLEGPSKREQAKAMALAWYHCATAVLDYLRADCPAVPDLRDRRLVPEPIERLVQIAQT